MRPASDGYRLRVGLHHARLGVDQREDALAGRQPLLELAPERGDAGQREPEDRDALDEEKPRARRDAAMQDAQAAEVDDDDGAQAGDGVQDREDAVEDEARPPVDLIRLRC